LRALDELLIIVDRTQVANRIVAGTMNQGTLEWSSR